jgi:hypothetical protein
MSQTVDRFQRPLPVRMAIPRSFNETGNRIDAEAQLRINLKHQPHQLGLGLASAVSSYSYGLLVEGSSGTFRTGGDELRMGDGHRSVESSYTDFVRYANL